MGVRYKNCRDCIYGCLLYGGTISCDYIFKVGRKRPCPPGDDCTVKIKRKRKRRTKNAEN
jgi:hypothetical protein